MKKQLILNTLKFLERRANETDSRYEWREACGLIQEITEACSISEDEYNLIVEELRTERLNKKLKLYLTPNPCDEISLGEFTPTIL